MAALDRAEDGHLGGGPVDAEVTGNRRVEVVVHGGGSKGGIAGHGGQDPGLDLAQRPRVGPGRRTSDSQGFGGR